MTRRQHVTDRTVTLRSMDYGRHLLEPATVLPLRTCTNTRPWKQDISTTRVVELLLTVMIYSYIQLSL